MHSSYGVSAACQPRYGACLDGTRFIPVKVLDVAGLVPGASEGLGLGNKVGAAAAPGSYVLSLISVLLCLVQPLGAVLG